MMNILSFRERPHSHRLLDKQYAELQLLDFVIDGEWLEELIRAALGWRPDERVNHEPPFGWGDPQEQRRTARWLLGREEYPADPGRPPVLICPLDGDLYCGYISARVQLAEETVLWDQFGDSYFDWGHNGEVATVPDRFEGLAFEFDRTQYEAAFERLLRRISARPS